MQSYSASEVYEKVKNSVGEITVYDKSGSSIALGTCFVYAKDGKIITNYHVIEDAYSASVSINGGTYTVSKILAYDEQIDLAVLKISETNLPVLTFCKKEHDVGKSVYAIGSSRGLTSTFTQGIITTANRELDGVNYVQHDAAISNGNSGGPLINEYCEVIGINTMTIKDSQNLNFAIRVNEIDNLDFSTSIDFGKHNGVVDSGSSSSGTTSNLFNTIKNLAVTKGEYDDGEYQYDFYKTDNFVYGIYYDTADKCIEFTLFWVNDAGTLSDMIFITMDEIDGIYDWTYVGGNPNSSSYNYMSGVLYANTWTQNSLLTVSDYSIKTNTTLSSLKSTASISLNILLKGIDLKLSSYGITAYNLGFTKFTSSSSSSTSDLFTTMKNYAITNGTYDDGCYEVKYGTDYSSDYSTSYNFYIVYDVSTQEISFQLFAYSSNGLSFLVSFDVDKVDGVYDWSYVDSYDDYMSGQIVGSTWDTGYVLGYSYNNITSSSLRTTVRELASSSMNVLLYSIDEHLSSKGITAYKLGFKNF
ncbi:MAG: serine protease [Clostridia bacterium]|nr:serine protease [Clostridia bacterium]